MLYVEMEKSHIYQEGKLRHITGEVQREDIGPRTLSGVLSGGSKIPGFQEVSQHERDLTTLAGSSQDGGQSGSC